MYRLFKRGQVQSQTLIYIIALLTLSVILIFGYVSIRGYNEKTNQINLLQFQNGLKNDITSLSADYKSVKIKEYKLPSGFDKICFVDLEHFEESLDDSKFIINEPVIKDSVDSKAQKNFFLFGKNGLGTYYVEGLQIAAEPYYSCISNIKNVELEIEGRGDGSVVKTPPPKEDCEIAAQKDENGDDLCIQFNEYASQLYTSSCCKEYGLCCPP
jgi:hypothetical protein